MKHRWVAFIISVIGLGCLCYAGRVYYLRHYLGYGDAIRVPAKTLAHVTVSISNTGSKPKSFQSSDSSLGSALIELVNTSTPTIYCFCGNLGTITFSYADGSTNEIGFVPAHTKERYSLVEFAPPNSGRDILSYSTIDKKHFVSLMTKYGLNASWVEWAHLHQVLEEEAKSEAAKPKQRVTE